VTLIEVVDVKKDYPSHHGSISIINGVSFDVRDSDFVAIIGPSGCGKSTMLRIIQGLERPTAGEVRFRGKPVDSTCNEMAMVFQSFALLPWLSIKENVAFGLTARGWTPEKISAQVDRYISVTGLVGFEEAYPRELSGGMRQRVGLARALAVEPAVLLMDEPFSALDALTAEGLREEVLQLWRDPDLPPEAVVLVTHNIEEALLMADRVVVLSHRPSRVLSVVTVNLPRPRDRKSEAFYELTDYLYSLITEGSPPPGTAVKAPPESAAAPLPEASAKAASDDAPAAPGASE
jgi:NitT/TauT family transport system ATP-binding protein